MLVSSSLASALLATSVVSMGLTLAQRPKYQVHWLFVLFCLSLICMALSWLYAGQMGRSAHLLNMGACMTCNGYWLLTRALFRGEGGVRNIHLLVALSAALSMASIEGLRFIIDGDNTGLTAWLSPIIAIMQSGLSMLSPCFLLLALWEGCRAFRGAKGAEKYQCLLFVTAFASVLVATTLVVSAIKAAGGPNWDGPLSAVSAILMLVVTQVLILWRQPVFSASEQNGGSNTSTEQNSPIASESPQLSEPKANTEYGAEDQQLARELVVLMTDQRLYLMPSLKLVDVAKRLHTSEYRISRVIKAEQLASNFNQWVNALRIDHAKSLIDEPTGQSLSILSIALDSGFSSPSTFNRAFKLRFNCTPGEYRQQKLQTPAALTS